MECFPLKESSVYILSWKRLAKTETNDICWISGLTIFVMSGLTIGIIATGLCCGLLCFQPFLPNYSFVKSQKELKTRSHPQGLFVWELVAWLQGPTKSPFNGQWMPLVLKSGLWEVPIYFMILWGSFSHSVFYVDLHVSPPFLTFPNQMALRIILHLF